MTTPMPTLMTTTTKSRHHAVGYIRLSTEKQAEGDAEFETQARKIREACTRRGMNLLAVHEDTWSGVDPRGAHRREGLQAAVKRARDDEAVLVIPEPTRLFRNVEAAREFLSIHDVPVFSVRDDRILTNEELLDAIARGEQAARKIRVGTSEALASNGASVGTFSDDTVREKAVSESVKSRRQKADRIAYEIASVLRSDPAYRTLSHKALADLLNRRRIKSGWNRPWTEAGVRGPRKKAEALIAEQDEIHAADDLVAVSVNPAHVAHVSDQPAEVTLPVDPDDPEGQLRENPIFGMF